jgi:hypothetical protein
MEATWVARISIQKYMDGNMILTASFLPSSFCVLAKDWQASRVRLSDMDANAQDVWI